VRGEAPLGAIFLDSTSASHVFSEADVEMLMAIANQVVTALENARLYTDVRLAYEELQSAQEQLLRAERLSTVGSITASIAHDMANIVTPLKPLIEIGFREADADPELVEALTRQVERLTAMVERVTSFSRTEELKFEPININEIIQRTMTLIRSDVAHAAVDLEMDLAEDLPSVLADAAELDRVFLNLALNAVQAMEESDERTLTIRTEHDAEEVTVSFIDTGPGIPLAIQDKLFEPLFTTKPTGTGLGLHSCKRIVEDEHQGTIAVDSLEGEGATFSVHLPLAPHRAEAPNVLQPT
jgi:signal transduction histidine kinase